MVNAGRGDRAKDFYLEVEKGNVPGHTGVRVFGHNPDVDVGTEDVWEDGGTLTRMTSAETMNIVSTSTDDDGSPVGTGARTVQVDGLDGDFVAASEVVTMNGTTDVLTSNTYIRVSDLMVLTADATATNSNLGIITATASSAATVQAAMGVGDGLSHGIHYTVPAVKTGYLTKVELNVARNTSAVARVIYDAIITPPGAASFTIVKKAMTSDQSEIEIYFIPPVKFAAKSDIKMVATTDKADTELYARFMIIEVAD